MTLDRAEAAALRWVRGDEDTPWEAVKRGLNSLLRKGLVVSTYIPERDQYCWAPTRAGLGVMMEVAQ